jgi:hypothetical protein
MQIFELLVVKLNKFHHKVRIVITFVWNAKLADVIPFETYRRRILGFSNARSFWQKILIQYKFSNLNILSAFFVDFVNQAKWNVPVVTYLKFLDSYDLL